MVAKGCGRCQDLAADSAFPPEDNWCPRHTCFACGAGAPEAELWRDDRPTEFACPTCLECLWSKATEDILLASTQWQARAEKAEAKIVDMEQARDFPEKQATNCADCGVYKHTPWKGARGYSCAGCLANERDEARNLAVWAGLWAKASDGSGEQWIAFSPAGCLREKDGKRFWSKSFVAFRAMFPTEEAALEAGRALDWWPEAAELEAQRKAKVGP